MRKIISIMLSLMLVSSVCVCASAVIPEERQKPLLIDNADLLTDSEEYVLLNELERISEEYECEVAIVLEDGIGGADITAYADDFYDYNGYGYGNDDSGIMLVIDMQYREWATTTFGTAIRSFTDAWQDYIMEIVAEDLSDGNYNAAFSNFALLCEKTLEQAQSGAPYDYDDKIDYDGDDIVIEEDYYEYYGEKEQESDNIILFIVIPPVVGIACAIFVTGDMKSKLKTVRSEAAAKNYIQPGSLSIEQQSDVFLYKNVSKVRIESSSGGRSGGSSSHRSSSGRSHGGRSGRF